MVHLRHSDTLWFLKTTLYALRDSSAALAEAVLDITHEEK